MEPTSTVLYEFEVHATYNDGDEAVRLLFEVHAAVAFMKAAEMLASDDRLVKLTVSRHGTTLATFVLGAL